jgi:SH3-like domain-containing protein
LRHGEVNGRNGPGKAHKVKWVYRRAGLPVLIVRETEGWRQVRDPDGDLVWIEASQLSARSAALVRGPDGVTALRKPDAGAEPVVQFEAGVIVTLKGCEAGWCRISASGRQGYAPAAMLWGADPLEASL